MGTFTRSAISIVGAGCLVLLASGNQARAELTIKRVAADIYYGAAPQCEADYRQLQKLGIKTVVDVRKGRRREGEREACLLPGYGMVYRRIPMSFFPTRDLMPECALRVLADPSQRPIYLHCTLGRDRASLVVALYRVRYLGWSPEAAWCVSRAERFDRLLLDLNRYFRRYATCGPACGGRRN